MSRWGNYSYGTHIDYSVTPDCDVDGGDEESSGLIDEGMRDGELLRKVAIELVQKGDLLKILPGARIPTDGIVEKGCSYVDESMITGKA
jgi:hypothetical protein